MSYRLAPIVMYCCSLLSVISLPTNAASLMVQPGTTTAQPGETIYISIDLVSIVDVYSVQFDLRFDPLLLSAVSVNEGTFLSSGGPTFFVQGAIDNTAGTITFIANTLFGVAQGVSGDGTVATVQFSTLAVGSSLIALSNVFLLDSNSPPNTLVTAITDATVTSAPSSVPEPSALLLLGSGIGALILSRNRNR